MQRLAERLTASRSRVAAAAVAVGATVFASTRPPAEAATAPSALSPKEFQAFKLAKIEHVSHNTALYRFALPDPNAVVGLPVASCLVTRANIGEGGKPVVRPYTPISAPDARGHFDLLVKAYPNGVMSKHFASLKVGDTLECKGPMMKLEYRANMKTAIGMVAGGTGITPCLQVIEEVLRNPEDKTQLSLVFGNVSEEDILLKQRLDALAKKHPAQLSILYVLDKPPLLKKWSGGAGFITPAMLKERLPKPAEDTLILVCGPPGLMASVSGGKDPKDYSQGVLAGALKTLGYNEQMVLKL